MVSVTIPDSDLATIWIYASQSTMGEGHCRTKLQLRPRQDYDDLDSLSDEYILIQCSKHLQLTLNSQKGLHLIQVSTPENPSTKTKVCMKGSIRDLLTRMRT